MQLRRAMDRHDEDGIDERSFRFYCDVLAFVESIPPGPKTNGLIEQLVDAAARSETIGTRHSEARRAKNSLDTTRSRYAARTNASAGCVRVPPDGSAAMRNAWNCWTKLANSPASSLKS
jgi:hypothetical protein